jgi:hypothetical protein
LSQVETAAWRRSYGVVASGESATSVVKTASRAAPGAVNREPRYLSGVALALEQAPVRREPERCDVLVERRGQLRRAGHGAHFATGALLEVALIAVLAAVGPLLARVRLGPSHT